MGNDMAKMEGQFQGGKGGKKTGGANAKNREGTNVTATMHAEHKASGKKGKK